MSQTSPTQDLQPGNTRIAEDRAARILERAAALDAKRNTEIELDQLREAAEDAGISPQAFEQALRETASEPPPPAGKRGKVAPIGAGQPLAASDVGHYAALLSDVLGDDGRITVTDAIEWRDEQGLCVSVSPSSNKITATVTSEGKLRNKLLGVALPTLLPASLFLVWAADEEEGAVALVGLIFAVLLSLAGTWFTHRREQKKLRKKAERIRRQLQRMLTLAE
jgi:hypothetical protein